jgi:hypothetical protein
MTTSIGRLAAIALTLIAAAGCSTEGTPTLAAPIGAPTEASAGLVGTLGGVVNSTLTLATGMQRTAPLAESITVTKTIGAFGGTLSIPAAGVTVTVPAGALVAPTVITMTARAGSLIAYDFAPHGITFAKPLVFTQQLAGTNANPISALFFKLAYYPDASLLTQTTALVSELIDGAVNYRNWTYTSSIRHFSGYIISCGRDGMDRGE